MRLLTALHVYPLVGIALGAVGCSAPVVDAEEVADGGSMTQSIVLVERVVTVDGAPQTNVSAKFLRMAATADPDLAERAVGSRFEVPPAGTCRALAPTAASAKDAPKLSSLGSIELLDVGDVTLRAGGV